MDRLYDKLTSYCKEDYYPMHMPGHKRNTGLMQMVNPYEIDITEINGFDNLHQADGILKLLSERLSYLYRAGKSYPLINGSTAGILAGISAATHRGDKVLVARNCHKSVYHAITIRGLVPIYCYPQQVGEIIVNGGILLHDIEEALIKHKDITLVVITSPTYEGIISDVKAISEVVHRYGAVLLVDEAHGAHLGLYEELPKSAVSKGADIIIQSLHKTLPALTQTAVLHSNATRLNDKIEKYLSIYQSSSPSYLLMSGIDRCISILEDKGKTLFAAYYHELKEFYEAAKSLRKLKLLTSDYIGSYGIYDFDPSKLTIITANTQLTGHELQAILEEKYHLVMEMATPDYVLGMTSICDTKEGFRRLLTALMELDKESILAGGMKSNGFANKPKPSFVMLPSEVLEYDQTEQIELKDSCGRIAAAFVSMYPPGTPILVQGERIDGEVLRFIDWIKQNKINITGLGAEADIIEVVCEHRKKD